MSAKQWLVVGIGGATCSGKTTLAKKLNEIFPESVLLHQDDHFLDLAKQTRVDELNHWNFEILSSLDNDAYYNQIHSILNSETKFGFTPNEFYSKFKDRIPSNSKKMSFVPNLLIIEGFLLLSEPRLIELSDVKFFMTLDRDTCLARRSARTYGPPDVPGYFDLCVWPWYEYYKKEAEEKVEDVTYFSGTDRQEDLLEKALNVIIEQLIHSF